MNIVMLSGGKDSTAMLILMKKHNIKIDKVVFFDGGWEFPQMYDHLDQVEKILDVKIDRIKPPHDFNYYMFDHIKTRGKRKGCKGYGWPHAGRRWCTGIKLNTIKKHLNKFEKYTSYIGIAADEGRRIKSDPRTEYPLVEFEVTEKEALELCYKHGFSFGGLYKYFRRVSCYRCPLQRIGELQNLFKYFPELFQKMCEMDKHSKYPYPTGKTLEYYRKRFEGEKKQLQLFETA